MANFKIIWSPRAEKSYVKISDFILEKWSKKEVKKFDDIALSTILKIAKNPEMFVASRQQKNIRKGFISKHTSLIYKIKSNKIIELVFFWDNRQNSKKLKL